VQHSSEQSNQQSTDERQRIGMTEEQIERIAEREMNRLDKELLNGSITQEEYNQEVRELDHWIKEEYRHSKYD
jgi:hypothetical protein